MLYAYSFPAVHLNAMQRTRRAYKGETGKVLLLSSTCCSLPRQQLFQPTTSSPLAFGSWLLPPDLEDFGIDVVAALAEAAEKYEVYPAMNVCHQRMK